MVEQVWKHPERFEELFRCYWSEDEVVRLRNSNAKKRVESERRDLLVPFIDRFMKDVMQLEKSSAPWTLAQLFDHNIDLRVDD